MENKIAAAISTEEMAINRTIVSFIDKENNWTGSIISNSGTERIVTVNSLSGLFSKGKKISVMLSENKPNKAIHPPANAAA